MRLEGFPFWVALFAFRPELEPPAVILRPNRQRYAYTSAGI